MASFCFFRILLLFAYLRKFLFIYKYKFLKSIIMSVFVELPYLNIRRFFIHHWLINIEVEEKELG